MRASKLMAHCAICQQRPSSGLPVPDRVYFTVRTSVHGLRPHSLGRSLDVSAPMQGNGSSLLRTGPLAGQSSHSRLIGALIFQVLRDDRDLPYSSSQFGSSLASGSAPNQMF